MEEYTISFLSLTALFLLLILMVFSLSFVFKLKTIIGDMDCVVYSFFYHYRLYSGIRGSFFNLIELVVVGDCPIVL